MRWISLLGAVLAACSTVAPRLTSNVDDYADYRRARTATTLEQRLSASFDYLRRHQDGEWAAEVRSWFDKAEADYYRRARNSLPRLRRYLSTLPEGPHADAAAKRIVELELAVEHRRRREKMLVDYAEDIEEELALAARRRRAFVRAFSRWATHVAGIRVWGGRTSELPHELIHEWRIVVPRARCVGDRCTKAMSFPYAIPDEQRLMPRQALMDVRIDLVEGGIAEASIRGPELFSRVGEAVQLAPIDRSDPQARAEAIARAVQLVRTAIEGELPERRCAREAVGSVVLARECDGVRLTMAAAASVESEDRIEVRPVVVTPPPDDGGAADPVRDGPGPDAGPG